MQIIVDTREQLPLWKAARKCVRKCLLVGDYSTVELQSSFSVERKSPQDLYGTLTKGHVRFRKEIVRAANNNIKLVMYVESSRADFVAKKFPGGSERKFSSDGLDKMLNTIQRKYKLEIVWCKNRACLKREVENRLLLEEFKFRKSGR